MPNFKGTIVSDQWGKNNFMQMEKGYFTVFPYPFSAPQVPRPVSVSDNMISPLEIDELNGVNFKNLKNHFSVALIDTGVTSNHPYLSGTPIQLLHTTNVKDGSADMHGHGTHLSGLISGTNTVTGMFPAAPITSIKVTEGDSGSTTWSAISEALQLVIDQMESNEMQFPFPVSVVNLSFNSIDNIETPGGELFALHQKILQLESMNIPVVVSAGNYFDLFQRSSEKPPQYGLGFPAHYAEVISAGSGGQNDPGATIIARQELAIYSQRISSEYISGEVDNRTFVIAPTYVTVSAGLPTSRSNSSKLFGTSSAAAVVCGLILHLQETYFKTHGTLPTVQQIRMALKKGCDRLNNSVASSYAAGIHTHWRRTFFDDHQYLYLNRKKIISSI